ncbi:hypothetical protein [Chromobacterium subtsugae]|uniref:hypothetical protein n=1 Tax=Chromobacterium subtsugae TaxID=251747 RepID=UPI000AB560FC|nr:hypothetical protein [Chromobacterium subtsugae]
MASFHSLGLSGTNESNTVDERNQNQNVQGDFNGQLANGNINNHIYSGQDRERLTAAEVWPIKLKGRQLIDLLGKDSVEVWGPLKEILGEGHNELFRDQEKAAHAILDLWIAQAERQDEASAGQQADLLIQLSELKAKYTEAQSTEKKLRKQHAETTERLRQAQQAYSSLEQLHRQQTASLNTLSNQLRQAQETTPRAHTCASCYAATFKLASTRKGLVTASVMAGLAIAVSVVLGYSNYQASKRASTAEMLVRSCEFHGKAYSIGSIIDNPQADDVQCVASPQGGQPNWQTIKPTKRAAQHSAPAKSRAKHARHAPAHSVPAQPTEQETEAVVPESNPQLF